MEQLQKNLRSDIEKSIGFRIQSTTEAKTFLNILTESDILDISLSTIRRFWGLIPSRKARQHTLNKLSEFLGYRSFYDYIKAKNTFEHLSLDANLQRLRHKEKLGSDDFKFMGALFRKSGQTHFFTSLFEFALMFEKWNYLAQLFDESNNTLLLIKDHRNSFLMSVSYQINIFLKAIPQELFEKFADKVLPLEGFRNNIVYIYIDLMNINGRYGFMLERVSIEKATPGERLFLNLIMNLRLYLNGGTPVSFEIAESDVKPLPDVLKGRYYGYQVLVSTLARDEERAVRFFQKFMRDIALNTYIRNYAHEFIHHLMLAKRFKMLDEVITTFYDTILDDYHTHSYLDEFIINLNEIIFKMLKSETKGAKRLYLSLDLRKIEYGSYCDFYLIFYHIVGYHISNGPKEKHKHKTAYEKLTAAAAFNRLDDHYLLNYIRLPATNMLASP